MTRYDKLVRDRIPEIVEADGETPITHRADDAEYDRRLREKIVEEAREFEESGDPEELADVLAVVEAICAFEGIDPERLAELRREKRERRGGFGDRIVLERVDEDGSGTEE
ncbi:nucleoside triphosphate pyrophosphohydrolase [Saliphagus sp. LR7]|uniref:nucleoside triphosphate pyrophosphohydrolase n=1 Tax=Saliphagus sp. LR7 TaxID=2282654 RepID=UPI000DF777FA|nr:nucleoside triphosphate pyrophosphohydrolase [Saliphagus sp. LR7]